MFAVNANFSFLLQYFATFCLVNLAHFLFLAIPDIFSIIWHFVAPLLWTHPYNVPLGLLATSLLGN